MQIDLNPEEEIEFVISKRKSFPFRDEDFLRIPMLIGVLFILYFANNTFSRGFSKGFVAYFYLISALFSFILFSVVKNYYKRLLIAFKWKYIVTNKRLFVLNHKNTIEHSFYYDNFPEINFSENLYGNGYLIIGKKQPVFSSSSSFLHYRMGVNFSEEDLILYNIENVKNVSKLIKSRITNYATQ
ncbi:hypothetical protein [Flavobacterium foetidum]|uniref:hypothetical protein n=1 Tax=Flavobacterium foetidum TaxID=2026681 RepID=UPI001074EA96|nr:hypothetical protein [Flavobacterium foetidum]KAF2517905.1 hypothetical protein E0W73_01465 [Flavobacterium foetidum]